MKRYGIAILTAALCLAACGKETGTAGAGTAQATETGTAQEEETAVPDETGENGETAGAQGPGTENDTATPAPLNVEIDSQYLGEWEGQTSLISSECQQVYILDDGYEDLKKSLDAFNEENAEYISDMYEEALLAAREGYEAFPESFHGYRWDYDLEVRRADERVLSLRTLETTDMGGAHPNYAPGGANFDVETGERLALSDVIPDMGWLEEWCLEQLAGREGLFEDYEEAVRPQFEESEPKWTLDTAGLTIHFSPYELAPYAEGEIRLVLPYEGNEERFSGKYFYQADQKAAHLKPWEPASLLVDGQEATVSLSAENDADTFECRISIALEAGETSQTYEDVFHGSFSDAYVLSAKDGASYLYMELQSENDWRNLEVFALGTDEIRHVGSLEESMYGHFIQNPERFYLYTRLNVLGTYMAYRPYRMGADGMPEPESEIYTRSSWRETPEEDFITSTRELMVYMHEEASAEIGKAETDGIAGQAETGQAGTMGGAGSRTEEILPAGTKMKPCRTDGRTFVEMELEDGRRCDLPIERREGDYRLYVNGVDESECFETLAYAG